MNKEVQITKKNHDIKFLVIIGGLIVVKGIASLMLVG